LVPNEGGRLPEEKGGINRLGIARNSNRKTESPAVRSLKQIPGRQRKDNQKKRGGHAGTLEWSPTPKGETRRVIEARRTVWNNETHPTCSWGKKGRKLIYLALKQSGRGGLLAREAKKRAKIIAKGGRKRAEMMVVSGSETIE